MCAGAEEDSDPQRWTQGHAAVSLGGFSGQIIYDFPVIYLFIVVSYLT